MSRQSYMQTQAARRSRESGTVLVLFALLMVGVFGLLGAVVDGGRLRVTRQQMDAGAECGALEGLRFKDLEGDAARRARAIRAVENLFDDDFEPANGDALGLGAGTLPVVFDETPFQGTIDVPINPADRSWKPAAALEPNVNNAIHGDLVAGAHIAVGDAIEDDSFTRGDFAPTSPNSLPADLAGSPSFLLRLRRASERLDLDRQPGESSAGPPFEWLWARGAIWHEPLPGQTNASRADGVTIRSAAIASTSRALIASSDPVRGVSLASFALRVDGGAAWQATSPGATIQLTVDGSGLLLMTGSEQGAVTAATVARVGAVAAVAPNAAPSPSPGITIVPVYAVFAGARVVAGFTLATVSISGADLLVTRLQSAVLPAGASSAAPTALDARVALQANPSLAALHASISEPLLAPTLRR